MTAQQSQALLARVLDVVRGVAPAEAARGSAHDADALAALASGFVDAGAAWLVTAATPRTWVQVNAAFDPSERRPGTTLVSGRLAGALVEAHGNGTIEEFHYVFKPPGVRLRFLGERTRLAALLDPLLEQLVDDRAIVSPARGSYDPETFQFGGEDGLALAHAFFTAESLAVLQYIQLAARGRATVGAPEFSLILVDLFLRGLVGDEWELWDLWCRLDLTGRAAGADDSTGALAGKSVAPLLESLRARDATLAWVPEPERGYLLAYAARLPPLVARARALHERGALHFPLRQIVPFWLVFHFNRMGFSADHQRFLQLAMTGALSPKHGRAASRT